MKRIEIKSYTGSTLNGVIKDITFSNFTMTINSGLGSCIFTLARKFDSFNTLGDVSLGNKIEIRIFDKDSGNDGVLIYTGYIEQHQPFIDGGKESVDIICLGVVNKLASDVLKNAAQTKLFTNTTLGLGTSAATACEIQTVVKAIIDRYNAENGLGGVHYSTDGGISSVALTGSTINYIFNATNYLDAIIQCKNTAPQGYYFYLGADGVINLAASPATATHTFQVGKNIKSIRVQKGVDSLKNILLLNDGNSSGLYRQYKDDVSISLYGRRVQQQTQNGVQDAGTMDNIGVAFINQNKDPRIRVVMEIIDNNENDKGYDIESILPGQTCKVAGISYGDLLTNNMIIQDVQWKFEVATVTVESRPDFDMDTFILNLQKNIKVKDNTNLLASYTIV